MNTREIAIALEYYENGEPNTEYTRKLLSSGLMKGKKVNGRWSATRTQVEAYARKVRRFYHFPE